MSTTINVSGKIFKVSTEVIRRSQLFDTMMTDCSVDAEIIIDRSIKLFKHMYAFLLDPNYPYPKKYYSELDYYLVQYDKESLYDPNAKILEELETIKEDIEDMKMNVATIGEIKRRVATIEETIEEIKENSEFSDDICSSYYCDARCLRCRSYCKLHADHNF